MAEEAHEIQINCQRRSGRRVVSFDCELENDQWDGSVFLEAKDLSLRGVWVETLLPIEVGEKVQISLMPPGWPRRRPLVTSAVVAHVEMPRRQTDFCAAGMDLVFTHLGSQERLLLEEVLRRIPIRVSDQASTQ
jgi:hypothetical protein